MRLLFTFLAILIVSISFASEIKIKKGEFGEKSLFAQRFTTANKERVYELKYMGYRKYSIHVSNLTDYKEIAQESLISSKSDQSGVLTGKHKPVGLLASNNDAFLITSEKEGITKTYYKTKINSDGKLEESNELYQVNVKDKNTSEWYRSVYSQDKSKRFLAYSVEHKDGDHILSGALFDENFEKLKDVKVRIKDAFGVTSLKLTNNGTLVLSSSIIVHTESNGNKTEKEVYRVISHNCIKNRTNRYNCTVPGKYISDYGIEISTDQNTVIFTAMFGYEDGLEGGTDDANGIYTVMLDLNDQKKEIINHRDFTTEEATAIFGKKRDVKKGKGIGKWYVLKSIEPLSDGSFWAIFEFAQIKIYDNNQMLYVRNNLVASLISSEGEIKLIEHIEKNQLVSMLEITSITTTVINDKLHIFYNGHIDNVKDGVSKKLGSMNNTGLYKHVLTKTGKHMVELINTYADFSGVFMIYDAYKLTPNKLIVQTIKQNKMGGFGPYLSTRVTTSVGGIFIR